MRNGNTEQTEDCENSHQLVSLRFSNTREQEFLNFSGTRQHLETSAEIQIPKLKRFLIGSEWGPEAEAEFLTYRQDDSDVGFLRKSLVLCAQ